MPINAMQIDRRTNVDIVFDYLYKEIASLSLLPGTKISESEIAKKFDISRQPVRDAFSRLDNLGLLLIRPQRATEVRRFSLDTIEKTRFVRLSIELEAMNCAFENWEEAYLPQINACLDEQKEAVENGDADAFHQLDYEFHKLLCEIGKVDFAFDLIAENKAQVDRLCVLGLMDKIRMTELLNDHKQIVDGLVNRDLNALNTAMRKHLSRLDKTIAKIHMEHPTYFDK